MSSGFKNFKNGIGLVPNTTTKNTTKGDIESLTTDGKIRFHNGTTNEPLVGETTAATLTNKTLTAPVISTIVNTGTLTLPTSTDTLVGRATTDTLTNKSISGATNTLSNIANASLTNSSITINGSSVSLGGSTTITASTTSALTIGTGLSGTSFNGSAPVTIAIDSTVATLTGSQTLTNKVLSGNTAATLISGSGTLTLNTTGSITIPNATDTLVARNTTDTLTNKTLTAPVIATIVNTGTLTLPTSTDTLVGRATTDTLSNKTMGDALTFTQIATPSNPGSGLNKIYPKSDGFFYTLNNAGVESRIGTGSGITNFITYGDAESGTTGWATYADAAAASPVDGTGGSPTVTITTSGTAPLTGTSSYILTKDAANRQGEGWSYAFTIDSASQAKVLQIQCDYLVNSGTFVAGSDSTVSDVTFWIYDVTNATVIQPSTYKLLSNSTTIATRFISNFQTASNSTSYRLIMHVGSTSASAYSLKVDNVSVTATQYVYGTTITDWQSYNLVVGATTTAPTEGSGVVKAARYRRVGDSVEIRYNYSQTGAGSAGSGIYLFPLPSGLTIDTTKVTASATTQGAFGTAVGNGHLGGADSATGMKPSIVTPYNTTNLRFATDVNGTSTQAFASGVTSFAYSDAVLIYSFQAMVPVLGWSSSVQTSDSADSRTLIEQYTGNGGTSLTANVTNIDFTTKVTDTHGAWSGTVFTAPNAGQYNVVGSYQVTSASSAVLALYVGGVKKYTVSTNNSTVTKAFAGSIYLSAGETLTLRSDTTETLSNNATQHWINISRSPSSSVVSMTETVAASYYASANGTTSTTQTINFDTKQFDTHGAVTAPAAGTGTWKFTAPYSGIYSVSAMTSTTAQIYGQVYKNGTIYEAITDAPFAAGQASTGTLILKLIAGDFIDIRATASQTYQGNATPSGTNSSCKIHIHMVK